MKGTDFLKRRLSGALLFGILILFLPVIFIESRVLQYTNEVFMYPLDDTFIHLEIARNLTSGNWGVNHAFASASSSLLYTLVLTGFRFFSDSVTIPFVVNCVAGAVTIWVVHGWLKKHGVNSLARFLMILLVVFLTPLPLLMISGMEHTSQCLVSFLFIFYFSSGRSANR